MKEEKTFIFFTPYHQVPGIQIQAYLNRIFDLFLEFAQPNARRNRWLIYYFGASKSVTRVFRTPKRRIIYYYIRIPQTSSECAMVFRKSLVFIEYSYLHKKYK